MATSFVSTLPTQKVEAATYSDANTYYNAKLKEELQLLVNDLNSFELATGSLELYYKRTIKKAGYKAKVALRSNNYTLMSEAKYELEALYEDIKIAQIPNY
ncbi:complement inhibitor SCIN family protein [Staphylococcus lutrae]|nr:complement inhibitor SCIN family protein [Staphylococcus lutrae]